MLLCRPSRQMDSKFHKALKWSFDLNLDLVRMRPPLRNPLPTTTKMPETLHEQLVVRGLPERATITPTTATTTITDEVGDADAIRVFVNLCVGYVTQNTRPHLLI